MTKEEVLIEIAKELKRMNDRTESMSDFIKLSDVFRLIAGHSDYHGDNILSAFTCLAEGKAVNSITPIEVEQWYKE